MVRTVFWGEQGLAEVVSQGRLRLQVRGGSPGPTDPAPPVSKKMLPDCPSLKLPESWESREAAWAWLSPACSCCNLPGLCLPALFFPLKISFLFYFLE